MSRGAEVVSPAIRVEGRLRMPGDKSISHRALLVAALGTGEMQIDDLSPSEDVARSLEALRNLGLGVRESLKGPDHKPNSQLEGLPESRRLGNSQILVDSGGFADLVAPEGPIDVGNSGTTIRLLAGILSGSSVSATLTGDRSILNRPMGRVVEPLRRMGAEIDTAPGGRAPLVVRGAALHGFAHELPVASAQVKSALLFAGTVAAGETSITEPARSRDHTERMLRYLGVRIDSDTDRLIIKSTDIQNANISVPGDLSSAAFFLVAAAILPGSTIQIADVGLNPTRTGIVEILERFGATISIENLREVCGEPVGTISLESGDRRAVEVSGELALRAIDELPLVAVLGAFGEGVTILRDAAELRVKESDRIAAVCEAMRSLGASIEPAPDGFVVRGGSPLAGSRVDAAGDHRIAMAAAVAGLAASGETVITGWESVSVSHPGFEHDLERVVVR